MTRAERIAIRTARVKARNERISACKERELLTIQKANELNSLPVDPNKLLTIEICIHCHSYQKRLCWMLSSILQQKGDIPNIVVSIAHEQNNGTPTTEKVIDFFKDKGLKINDVVLKEGEGSNRAISRNIITKATKADWILYVDSDLVYDVYFFDRLKKKINLQFSNETKVIGADRNSLNDNFCIEYFNKDKRDYPCVIEAVSDIVKEWPCKWVSGGGIAAGYFQLANVKAIKDKGGFYSMRTGDLWRRTKSDRAFRCHMGGRVSVNLKTDIETGLQLIQYHLNHARTLGEQR